MRLSPRLNLLSIVKPGALLLRHGRVGYTNSIELDISASRIQPGHPSFLSRLLVAFLKRPFFSTAQVLPFDLVHYKLNNHRATFDEFRTGPLSLEDSFLVVGSVVLHTTTGFSATGTPPEGAGLANGMLARRMSALDGMNNKTLTATRSELCGYIVATEYYKVVGGHERGTCVLAEHGAPSIAYHEPGLGYKDRSVQDEMEEYVMSKIQEE